MSVVASSPEDLLQFLKSLPSTNDRAFEEQLANKLTHSPISIIEQLQIILDNVDDVDLRFRAFFGLSLHHRRQGNHSQFKKLVDLYIEEFKHIHLSYHVLALMHKGFGDRDGILKSIEYARIAVDKLNRHIGVLHNYCEAVANALEEELDIPAQDVTNAFSMIDTVITLAPDYAKFYCTKGRLLAREHKFTEAKTNIMRAIDLENSSSNDYSIRISDYKNHLVQVKTLELYTNFKKEIGDSAQAVKTTKTQVQDIVKAAKDNMDHMKNQNIQMLAYFTGIISFIIGSISLLSKQQTFMETAMLMMILAGILILANAGLSVFMDTVKKNMLWKYLLGIGLGAGLIILGLLTHHYAT